MRFALLLTAAHLATAAQLRGEERFGWKVTGDTSGALAGCSARAAIGAISRWFTAFNAADSAGLASATARQFVFSTGKHWTISDQHRRIDNSLLELLAYARERGRQHERLVLESVHFYTWRGARLGFMPYYTRSADDLAPQPLAGLGKGEYLCHQGIRVLNLAPRTQAPSAPKSQEHTPRDEPQHP